MAAEATLKGAAGLSFKEEKAEEPSEDEEVQKEKRRTDMTRCEGEGKEGRGR